MADFSGFVNCLNIRQQLVNLRRKTFVAFAVVPPRFITHLSWVEGVRN